MSTGESFKGGESAPESINPVLGEYSIKDKEFEFVPDNWQDRLLALFENMDHVVVSGDENRFAIKNERFGSGDLDYYFMKGNDLDTRALAEFEWIWKLYEAIAHKYNTEHPDDDPISVVDALNGINLNMLVGPHENGENASEYDTHCDRNRITAVLFATDEGGPTVFYDPKDVNGEPVYKLNPHGGNICVFTGREYPHTIIPPTTPGAKRLTLVFSFTTPGEDYPPQPENNSPFV
jgi:hypothetical protein